MAQTTTTTETNTSNGVTTKVKKWILTEHPNGDFVASTNSKLVEEDLDMTKFEEQDDHVLVKVEALSIDAFVRTMLDETAYHGSVKPGSTLPALGYGTVVKAGPKATHKEGAVVMGLLGATTMAVMKSSELNAPLTLPGVPRSTSLGLLGISGLTAYSGMFLAPPDVPKKGETVLVSAAAGSTGCMAAQMAKLSGCRVVGVAGGAVKKQFLLEKLQLDGAIDYKDDSKTLQEQLDDQCPDGIDFFFDNVGGELLDAVLERINRHARIVICGAISQYSSGSINKKGSVQGPSHYVKLAETSSSMTGFNMMHHASKFFKAIPYLLWHYYRGNLVPHEHIESGLESFPTALEKMFSGGGHVGRLLVDVSGDLTKK